MPLNTVAIRGNNIFPTVNQPVVTLKVLGSNNNNNNNNNND